MHRKKIFSSVVFFIIGITLFWFVYRDFDISELQTALKDLKYGWVFLSVLFGLLSHFLRAVRWEMLIVTMDHKPRTFNLFLAIIVLYFTNLIVPRGGEVSRCAVISRYENISFIKLIGTVFIERIVDLLTFLLIFFFLLVWQFSFFRTIFSYPEFKFDFSSLNDKLLPIILIIISFGILIFILAKFRVFSKIYHKLKKLKGDFLEGISVILHMKGRIRFVSYSLLIFLLWFLMLYVMFFAYPATAGLTFTVAVLTYTFANLAYLLPIQAGIGTWHFIVISCLFFYGIDKETGMVFALIAHTFTNLIFLIFGPIAMALLPVVNSKNRVSA
jgi:hypothetical protein